MLTCGFSTADKELRNDVAAVTSLLVAVPEFTQCCHSSGMLTALMAVATCPEMGTHADVVAAFALTNEELDLELRLLR
jgi:hypothetical protein